MVCQLSFPRLFLLDERVPADFQKTLGKGYPHVETREVANFSFSVPGGTSLPFEKKVIYDFISPDRAYVVSLCSEFIAFRATKYVCWEDFFAHITAGVAALYASYTIPNISRVGLRYVNVIDRDGLGLGSERWDDLIRNAALGLMGDADLPANDIVDCASSTVLRLTKGSVVVRNGPFLEIGAKPIKYVIDADFFYDQPIDDIKEAFSLLGEYNAAARNAFRWFIKEKLHDALVSGPA